MKPHQGKRFFCALLLFGAAITACQPESSNTPSSHTVTQAIEHDPRLDSWLMEKGAGEHQVMITYNRPPGPDEERAIAAFDGKVLARWDQCAWVIMAHATIDTAKMLVRDDPGILAIELDGGGSGAMVNALHQVGTRQLGSVGINGVTYSGEGITVAVIDSGIDGSHPDIASRIVGWMDMAGPDGRSPGFYAEPTDVPGHGTAVAGIAVGTGEGSQPESYRITASQPLPNSEGTSIVQYFPVRMLDQDRAISIEFETMAPQPGVHIATLFNAEGEQLLSQESADDPTTFLFPGSALAPFESFNAAIALTASDDDDVDTSNVLLEAQLEIPFTPRDERPPTIGVASGANLYGIKLLSDNNSFNSSSIILDVLTWLYTDGHNEGIDIANMSLNFYRGGPNMAVDSSVNRLVNEQGIPLVVSGRNGQRNGIAVASPATASSALAVGAISPTEAITDYSSQGTPSESIIKPDIVAPGGSSFTGLMVLSDSNNTPCKHFAQNCGLSEDRYRDDYMLWAGTSFAAPHVTGMLALMLEAAEAEGQRETMTPARLRSLLFMTATEVGVGEVATPGPPGRDLVPKDRSEGYGRMNSEAAIEAIVKRWEGDAPATETVYFGGAFGDRRAWASRLTIPQGFQARVVATGALGMDVDLYVYDADHPSDAPVVLAASANPNEDGSEELLVSALAEPLEVIVVAKRLAGQGEVALARWITPLECLEQFEQLGEPCFVGDGVCLVEGSMICSEDGASLVCSATPREPSDELCGTDDDEDCDGNIDEGFDALSEPCESGEGICAVPGSFMCSDDRLSLACSAIPREPDFNDLCGDGLDNDCDGQTDEGFETRDMPCSVGIGACNTIGAWVCDARQLELVCSATAGSPTIDLCGDEIDNDCDESVDEGYPSVGLACDEGVGACNAEGEWVCQPNGLGVICNAVTLEPSANDLCGNSIDDDCDGGVDEGFRALGGTCDSGEGVCTATGEFVCTPDLLALTCSAAPQEPESSELCGDALDNDCDGQTDEGFETLEEDCDAGIGACRATGSFVCSPDQTELFCPAVPTLPSEELCGSNTDEDCDGQTDEGFDLGEPCTVGQGVCEVEGQKVCAPGKLATVCGVAALGVPTAEDDICDNMLDDDCDGQVDEGCAESEPTPPSTGGGGQDGCSCAVNRPAHNTAVPAFSLMLTLCLLLRRRT